MSASVKNKGVFFISAIIVYVAALLLYVIFDYFYHQKQILDQVDSKLLQAALTLKYILPDNFHDRASSPQAIPLIEDKYFASKLTELIKEAGFKYAYTIIKQKNSLYFVACDLVEDPKNERGTFYFYEYKNADKSFYQAFEKKEPTFNTINDQWGTVRTVMVPEKSPGGVHYLACIDYDITYVNKLLRKNTYKSFFAVLLFLLLTIPILKLYINSYKSALDKATNSEQKFRTFVEAAPLAIAIIREDQYLYVNPAWVELTGYTKEEAGGIHPTDIIHPDMREMVKDRAKKRLRYMDVESRYEMKGLTKNGNIIWYDFSANLIEYENNPAILYFLSNISDNKRLEQEREKTIQELQSALEEIKTLKGIIPICANCKKIRDDQGYWNQLETYIQQHSDAAFSHGVCPECADKMYGDKTWYIKMKNKKKIEK